MVQLHQIRGMCLEEVVRHLLKATGYRPIDSSDVAKDPTLDVGSAGMIVRGRGSDHQIDAISDFLVQQPFSNPQRLLVEAKCYNNSTNVDLGVVRNALGTLRDVSEYWTREDHATKQDHLPKPRYHYQYAVFSATGYTKPAQEFAYAHDIYLFNVARSRYFQPIIQGIRDAAEGLSETSESIGVLRSKLRSRLDSPRPHLASSESSLSEDPLDLVVEACRRIRWALITVFGGRFPVFLVPNPSTNFEELQSPLTVRVSWNDHGWYIENTVNEELFSFDLPSDLFRYYADSGRLSIQAALNLKSSEMARFHAVRSITEQIELLEFRLEREWIETIRKHL